MPTSLAFLSQEIRVMGGYSSTNHAKDVQVLLSGSTFNAVVIVTAVMMGCRSDRDSLWRGWIDSQQMTQLTSIRGPGDVLCRQIPALEAAAVGLRIHIGVTVPMPIALAIVVCS